MAQSVGVPPRWSCCLPSREILPHGIEEKIIKDARAPENFELPAGDAVCINWIPIVCTILLCFDPQYQQLQVQSKSLTVQLALA